MKRKIPIYNLKIFALLVIISFASCSNELDQFNDQCQEVRAEDDAITFATRSATSGNGDVDFSNFPDIRRIKEEVYTEAKRVWWETVVEATTGPRRERGFWIYYNIKTDEIFCGEEEQGVDRSPDPWDRPYDREINLSGPLEIKDSIYVCADYHTHPPLFMRAYDFEVLPLGPSDPDIAAANNDSIPGLVGDFDRWIENRNSSNEDYFQLSEFGPGKRTRVRGF